MISKATARLLQKSPYICPSCARHLRLAGAMIQKRNITQGYIQKTLEAKLDWARQSTEIKSKNKESMLSMLENRGYVDQIVGSRDDLERLMTEKRIGIYCGVDPTAPSLHVGHLLPLMVLYWSYVKGFHACSLLGGATAQIGDPIGRTTTRESQQSSVRKVNMMKTHLQLKGMWQHVEDRARDYGYRWEWAWRRELTNNNAWLNKLPVLELLKLAGRGTRLGPMLGRHTVKTRMKSKEGMSFAEFAYPLLQAWDWWHMYSTKDIQVQVGGSDQFGNILAGIDTINWIRHNHYNPDLLQDENAMKEKEALLKRPMGFTVPLLTTSSGEKFGKSAGNAVWLDAEMTSPFDLYQFFLRLADADVHRYLKLFTFEPLDELENLMQEHNKDAAKRIAQHKLAMEVLRIVHGQKIAQKTEEEHRSLFKKPSIDVPHTPAIANGERPPDENRSLNETAPIVNADSPPFHSLTLPKSLVYNQPISRVLYHAGMVASRSEGHRMVVNKGVYLGARPNRTGKMGDNVDWTPVTDFEGGDTEMYIIGGDTMFIRIGKWKIKIIKIISDEDFEEQRLTAPGWEDIRKAKVGKPLTDHEGVEPDAKPVRAEPASLKELL